MTTITLEVSDQMASDLREHLKSRFYLRDGSSMRGIVYQR